MSPRPSWTHSRDHGSRWPRSRWTLYLLLALLLCLLPACMKRSADSAYYDAPSSGYSGEESTMAAYDEAPTSRAPSRPRPSAKGESAGVFAPPPAPPPGAASPAPEPQAEQATAEPSASRMVHYDGWARLRVTRTEELIATISGIAREAGGEVESATPARVVIRVPVSSFDTIFEQILKLGDVLDKSISATDITDAFTSVDLRLRTARATRKRLQALLARAKDEEKLELLRQIQRLTEEIDLLDSQVRMLASLASFSTITIEAVPRQAVSQRNASEEVAGMGWIQELSPFKKYVSQRGRLLKLDTPEGFVPLNEKAHFVAESADGAQIWSTRMENQPQGDAAFWIEAIQRRLSPEFASSDSSAVGGYQVLRLVDGSEQPYIYLIGIHIQDDELHLIEVYFPSKAQEERYGSAIRQTIVGRIG